MASSLPNPVWLNVGGEQFCCSLETLTWHDETFFSFGIQFRLKSFEKKIWKIKKQKNVAKNLSRFFGIISRGGCRYKIWSKWKNIYWPRSRFISSHFALFTDAENFNPKRYGHFVIIAWSRILWLIRNVFSFGHLCKIIGRIMWRDPFLRTFTTRKNAKRPRLLHCRSWTNDSHCTYKTIRLGYEPYIHIFFHFLIIRVILGEDIF